MKTDQLDHAFQPLHTGDDICVEAVPVTRDGKRRWVICARPAADHPAEDQPSGVAGPPCGAQSRPDSKLSCVLPAGHAAPVNLQATRSLHTGVASDGSRRQFWVWSS